MCEVAADGVWRYPLQRALRWILFCILAPQAPVLASHSPVPSMALSHGADSHIPMGSAGFAALGLGTHLNGDVVWPWLTPLVRPCLCY